MVSTTNATTNEPAEPNLPFGAEDLRQMSRGDLKRLFSRLAAPDLSEMDGEFHAELLEQGGPIQNWLTGFFFRRHGDWLGKAFTPVNAEQGQGYNFFRQGESIVQLFPMQTFVAEGRLAEGNSYFLEYRPYNRGIMRTMVDEIRRVDSGLYLGIGVVGPSFTSSIKLQRKLPFLLTGPERPFHIESDSVRAALSETY